MVLLSAAIVRLCQSCEALTVVMEAERHYCTQQLDRIKAVYVSNTESKSL